MDIFLDFVKAFFVGGTLCLIAQILIDRTKATPGRILVVKTANISFNWHCNINSFLI